MGPPPSPFKSIKTFKNRIFWDTFIIKKLKLKYTTFISWFRDEWCDGQEGCSELLVEAALKPPGGSIPLMMDSKNRRGKKKCIRLRQVQVVVLVLPDDVMHPSPSGESASEAATHQLPFDWYIVYMQMTYCAMSGSFSHHCCSCMFITDYLVRLSNFEYTKYTIGWLIPDIRIPHSYRLKKYLYRIGSLFLFRKTEGLLAATTYLMTPLSSCARLVNCFASSYVVSLSPFMSCNGH